MKEKEEKLRVRAEQAVEVETPFDGDKLRRKRCAEDLEKVLSQGQAPFVLALDAQWGSGKTWFLTHFEKYLTTLEEPYPVVSFNAWRNDFSDNPLYSLIGEITEQFSDAKGAKTANALKGIGFSILRRSIPAAIRIASAGVIDLPVLSEDYEKALSTEAGKVLSEKAEEAFSELNAAKASIRGFRKALEKFASEVGDPATGRPLVFLIDELDRCKPSYAIEFLEVAKHLFDSEGVVFIIATDLKQLSAAVAAEYGPKIDHAAYMRRFVDYSYRFPTPTLEEFVDAQIAATNNSGLRSAPAGTYVFKALFRTLDVDLRSQQKAITQYSIGSLGFSFSGIRYEVFQMLQFLIVVSEHRPKVHHELLEGRYKEPSEIASVLAPDLTQSSNDFSREDISLMEAICDLLTAINGELPSEFIEARDEGSKQPPVLNHVAQNARYHPQIVASHQHSFSQAKGIHDFAYSFNFN